MYQRSATKESWAARHIPLWFREGMAIWTTHGEYRVATLEDLAHWLEENPELDPIAEAEALSQDHQHQIYGLAVHAFRRLLALHQEPVVRAIMAKMAQGADFTEAFAAATGTARADFERAFLIELRTRAFRERPAIGPRP
jgi:hypothetical protein